MSVNDQLREMVGFMEGTQEQMADQLDVSQQQISQFKLGKRGLSIESAEKIAGYFGYKLELKKHD